MKKPHRVSWVWLFLLPLCVFPMVPGLLLDAARAEGPWNGHAAAFTFSADDGNRPDNLAWADIFISRGLSFTAFVPSAWVGWTERNKLTVADLNYLHLNGIEIANHGRTHVRLTEVTEEQLLDELLRSALELEAMIDGEYRCRSHAYPAHAHDFHVMAVLDSLGYTGARDGGADSQGYPNFSLGKANWPDINLFDLPVTVVASFLVGTNNSFTEGETRTRVRQLLAATIPNNTWINIYAHTLADFDVPHMTWIVDELQQGDVWIHNFSAIADYYRVGHGLPVPVGVGSSTPVLLSRFAAVSVAEGILVDWTVSPDARFAGFHVHRSTAFETGYVRLTAEAIPSTASPQFLDRDVAPDVVYYYQLEALDSAGASIFFGPISARIGLRPVLGQAFPNPSRDGASLIPFSLTSSGPVRLRVLHISGRDVRTLADGVMDAGERGIVWDGLDDRGVLAPAGIYLYELVTPGFRGTRKLVKLR